MLFRSLVMVFEFCTEYSKIFTTETYWWYSLCFGDKMECLISFNKINIIKIRRHSKQKEFNINSKSLKNPKTVLNSDLTKSVERSIISVTVDLQCGEISQFQGSKGL